MVTTFIIPAPTIGVAIKIDSYVFIDDSYQSNLVNEFGVFDDDVSDNVARNNHSHP